MPAIRFCLTSGLLDRVMPVLAVRVEFTERDRESLVAALGIPVGHTQTSRGHNVLALGVDLCLSV